MSSTGTGIKQRALAMLAQNLPASVVSSRLGVTDSAIAQMMVDPGFAEELESKRIALSEKDQGFDNLLEETEQDLLERIKEKAKFGNLQATIQAFKAVNGAKRRKDGSQNVPAQQGTAVMINMPTVIIPQYIMNSKSEIVEVDGKTMLSASPARLNEIMEQRTGIAVKLVNDNQKRAAEVLESVTRSVIQPTRRNTKMIPQVDLVDLL